MRMNAKSGWKGEKERMGKRERKGIALHCCCVVLVTWGGGTVWDCDTLLVT